MANRDQMQSKAELQLPFLKNQFDAENLTALSALHKTNESARRSDPTLTTAAVKAAWKPGILRLFNISHKAALVIRCTSCFFLRFFV